MSLSITINGPNGIVIATESRISMHLHNHDNELVPTTFDNNNKLLSFLPYQKHVGCSYCGLGSYDRRLLSTIMSEFMATLPTERISVEEMANRISDYLMGIWKQSPMSTWLPDKHKIDMCICGYDKGDIMGKFYCICIPDSPKPSIAPFGRNDIAFMGQPDIVEKILYGYPSKLKRSLINVLGNDNENSIHRILDECKLPINYEIMSIQDYIELAKFLIETTIRAQSFSTDIRGCGGPIDIAVITQHDGFKFIQEKELHC